MSHSELVIFGEVLFDCFPDGTRVLGGAPFNVAWHCQAFGLRPLFISRVGDDSLGQEVRSAMQNWGLDVSGLQLDSAHATGIVDVSFNDGEPSYDIVKNSAWDFIDYQETPEIDKHSTLYHGSLALRNPVSARSLADLKQQGFKSVFIDVNLRPPWWGLSLIQNIMQSGQCIKLNAEELALVVPQHTDIESRMEFLLTSTNVKLVVVTRGGDGAIAARLDERCSVFPETISHVVDTVGAGDAFTSVLLLGLHKAWPLQEILNRAQHFASAVVQQRGATTQDKTFYEPFIEAWQL
ncbi:MAG: carbohydrate kinase [Gammaproteobacteria bacterium]|nr:carbohydrate kinase [Gammaproteobacteria bacterium]